MQLRIFGVKRDFWLIVGLFLVFSVLYSLLAITRHNHFQSQAIDFSTYDQALWSYSRFKVAYLTIYSNYDLADRFRPIMLPLSALYWFTTNERVILIFQAIILAAAVFPIWLLAKRLLPSVLAILVAFLYVDFIGIQATAVYDFHEMAVLPFFLGWLLFFLEKGKWREYFVVLVICLSVREIVGFLLAVLGVYIFLSKKNVKVALLTSIIAFSWSLVAIGFIMPKLGQNSYVSFVEQGDTLNSALVKYLTNPLLAIKYFFWPFEKTQTLFWSFFSFGLMPLFYLPLLPVIIFQFASRFLDLQHPVRWTLFYHYSAELSVLLSVAAIYGMKSFAKKLIKLRNWIIILGFMIFIAHALVNFSLHSPLKNLLKGQFWQEEPWMANTRVVLRQIPPDVSVAAQNNLLPHLSHRQKIYLLPNFNDAQYVAVDLHPGQDNWNFYTGNLESTKEQFKSLVMNEHYKPIISAGDVYLLAKKD